MRNPAQTRPGRLCGDEFGYVADAVELDVLDRARDIHRDLYRDHDAEENLARALSASRA